MTTAIDDHLPDWDTLPDLRRPTLLLGNGLSINLWSDFGYNSLYDEAGLSPEAEDVFAELDSTNFETALECVHHARLVLQALGCRTEQVEGLYTDIRDALFQAVHDVHIPWTVLPESTERLIAETLNKCTAVFTTNYDLCLYWSHLQDDAHVNMVDFFWGPGYRFDETDVTVRSSSTTPIYYLHGAIHLWQDDDGDNGKWTNADNGNLLAVQTNYSASSVRRPLFVSEGTSKAKARTIQRSPYLSFCLDTLREDDRDTVIFGHSLSAQDQHIVEALNHGTKRQVAVAVYPSGNPEHVIAEKARITEALNRHTVHFFDSATHPLGDPALRVR